MIQFDIITIFPHIFDSYFNTSIINRAQKSGLVKIKIHDLRLWTSDKHKTVDDRPYSGGPGMILKVEPIYKALKKIKTRETKKSRVILLTPQGRQFNQQRAKRLSKTEKVILICGRYEGVDERVNKFVDEKISIGPYVLTGGELPVMIIVDAITRLIPGVIRSESIKEESFNYQLTIKNQQSVFSLEYPQYTRPEVFTYKDKYGKIKKLPVPKVLLSGNHKEINEWKGNKSKFAR